MSTSYSSSIALIGCGDWGKNIARTLAKMDVLGGIIDPSAKAREIAADLKVPLLSLEGLLENPSIQGVVIATPTPTHFSLAKQLLRHGKSVLVEKPMAVQREEIEELEQIAKKYDLTLMVGHLLLYHAAFQNLVSLVKEGRLGEIITIEASRKNLGKVHAHEGVLWDLGPHDFSMVLTLLSGLPMDVFSQSKSYIYPEKADTQTVLMRYKTGTLVRVELSRLYPVKEHKLTVVGTKGAAVFDDTKEWAEKLVFYGHTLREGSSLLNKDMPEAMKMDASEPLREELIHFINCIENKTIPLSSATQAQQVLSLIKAAELSEKKNAWVSL